ncbi:MAG TPA: lytic transglycosylase domain-containing protein [Nevskiaceae bacterium]|nr:lytic transglycosylase domain-containing protein [Nevskiaceae bacterium]
MAVVAVLVAGGAAAAASDDNPIYLYRQSNGVRVYTDRKPDHSAWVIIAKYGRPTASASCTGLTAQSLDARASTYAPLIAKYASARGVPAALVRAVMRVESCFDHRAVSRVGARGLMQLMPETAAEMGVSDSFDPEQNISGGVHYLSMMLERFHQNRELALAAYNAGPEAVEKHGGIPPFPETQSYVRRVIASYRQQT